jgi:mannose-6-phosphate isomerase-like protein (cupin superfamily)/predicted DNA-binding transcriptional regulator AlpA
VTITHLTQEDVKEIRDSYNAPTKINPNGSRNYVSYEKLAKRYGVSQQTIYNIVNKKGRWSPESFPQAKVLQRVQGDLGKPTAGQRGVGLVGDRSHNEQEQPEPMMKPWGSHKELEKGVSRSIYGPSGSELYKIKTLVIQPGHETSTQYHNYRRELLICVSGEVSIQIGNMFGECLIKLAPGECEKVEREEVHRIMNRGKHPAIILELQLGERVDEDDIVRLDDVYGR